MNLVIVESPTKAKTLSKFLGKDYQVLASMGHVNDLPKSQFGIDVENDFKPEYSIPDKAQATVKILREAAKNAQTIWLSSDPDREGEAIAWHIAHVLGLGKTQNLKRAVFHEITPEAVKEAFAHPRDLDMNLVNSQQARRILDRIVGYRLSPLLWKKVARNLSAGRVQSVAVRLIVERERERTSFVPKEYWSITAELSKIPASPAGGPDLSAVGRFKAQLEEKDDKKIEINNKEEADQIVSELKTDSFKVDEVKKEERRRFPSPPFTTSTLQQTAGNKLGFSASRTMKAAQILYENGHITYMRTDSVNLSNQFLTAAADFINKNYGQSYLPSKPIQYKTKARLAQEAHEAIRPTDLELRIKNEELSGDEGKIYELIWKRAVASQMLPAVFDSTSVAIMASPYSSNDRRESRSTPEVLDAARTIKNEVYTLRATGSVLKFEGYLKVWGLEAVEGEENNVQKGFLPPLKENQNLVLVNLLPEQHFTQPSGRYTEATLVKALEEDGIGRPSTYAPTISTIQKRGYVGRDGRYLFPEDVGYVVNDLLVKHFPKIVDVDFTSKMEEELDLIAEGKKEWVPLIRNFYEPFEKLIKEKDKEIKREDVTKISETEEKCPECGKPLIVKLGRFGNFLSCTGFPDCKYARPITKTGANGQDSGGLAIDQTQLGKCPQDGGDLLVKQGRFGKFIACTNYPKCKYTKPYLNKVGMKCPTCKEGEVVAKKTGKGRPFFGCSRYPDCKFASWTKPGQSEGSNQTEEFPQAKTS